MCTCDTDLQINKKKKSHSETRLRFRVLNVNVSTMQLCGISHVSVPAGRQSCPASARAPPARCCASSAGSARSPDRGPAPGRGARPRGAWWRWPPPAPPGSAPPAAAARRRRASCPPAPSERWTAGKERTRVSVTETSTADNRRLVLPVLF